MMKKIIQMLINFFGVTKKGKPVKLDEFYMEYIKEGETTINNNENKKEMSESEKMVSRLVGHVPETVLNELKEVIEKFEINTPNRLSHFLGQCAHESGGFRIIRENLNYSAEGLMRIFKKYFTDILHAKTYERQPDKIANRVYANRMSNGSPETGDGWKFRGRGYIQLTGRHNYSLFDGFVKENIIEEPDLVATKYPLLSASWFFNTNGIHRLCDAGVSRENIIKITKRINGGTNGLEDRVTKTNVYFNLLK